MLNPPPPATSAALLDLRGFPVGDIVGATVGMPDRMTSKVVSCVMECDVIIEAHKKVHAV